MINIVTIVGNLTRDPEIKYTPAGKAVAKISIAHNEKRGEEERVSFFDVEAWGQVRGDMSGATLEGLPRRGERAACARQVAG